MGTECYSVRGLYTHRYCGHLSFFLAFQYLNLLILWGISTFEAERLLLYTVEGAKYSPLVSLATRGQEETIQTAVWRECWP